MSITETPVTIQLPELVDLPELGEEQSPHLECCRVERFFCGARYHPELSALELNSDLEEVCLACRKILVAFACWRGHQHCPIPLMGGFVCPDS